MGNRLLSNVSHDQLLSHDLEEQCRVNSNSMINLILIFVPCVPPLYICFYIFFILFILILILRILIPPLICVYLYIFILYFIFVNNTLLF
ncbi:hypothetical protein RchiOBHm_Chr7g0189151 [Rosa chinensis]|uniref:Uncharacterized protein n=1 Tax=Rosa chinensis TaxID=74649 RepID=A0A2P6P4R4_ROSCH|nr:hypothetical protein RchiOBHm_Chr7g0189151 [Rosa chinensis]